MVRLTSHLETSFHRNLASPGWLEQLAAHIETAIRAISGLETCAGVGKVYSQYNEARSMGPHSAVRYHFIVDVALDRAKPDAVQDRYQAWVRFRPDTNTFETQRESVDDQETRDKRCADAERQREAIESAVQELRKNFEGREAIHVERGALRVRVSGIRAVGDRFVADVEEVPSAGLQNSLLHRAHGGIAGPLKWQVSPRFSEVGRESEWVARDWSLIFDPQIVQGLVELAARWPDDLPGLARYCEVGCYLMERPGLGNRQGLPALRQPT